MLRQEFKLYFLKTLCRWGLEPCAEIDQHMTLLDFADKIIRESSMANDFCVGPLCTWVTSPWRSSNTIC